MEKWISLLSLEDETITILDEHKDGYCGVHLYYNNKIGTWFIAVIGILDEHELLHKLGYLWIWKKLGVYEKRKNMSPNFKIFGTAESCVMDNIIYYYFCNMDKEFNDYWINDTVKECTHWYVGSSWYLELPDMLYQYITHYLSYFYVLPGENQNELSNYILYELSKRRSEILEKCQNKHVNFTKREFRLLHKLLRKFNKTLNFNTYTDLEKYLLRVNEFYLKILGVRLNITTNKSVNQF